jgi:hypothetical protein
MWALVRRFVFAGGPIGQEDDLVFIRIKRIFGEVQVDVVTGGGQLKDGTPSLCVLEFADFRFPSLAKLDTSSFYLRIKK